MSDETIVTTTDTTEETTATTAATAVIETAATEETSAPAVVAVVKAQCIYVGPKLHKPFPVFPKTIFRGDLPKPLAAAVAVDHDLAACFVPVSELGVVKIRLKDAASALARSVAAVAARYTK